MITVVVYIAGVATPFALGVGILVLLAARYAWERRRDDRRRRRRPPKSLLERLQRADVLTVEDLEHLDQWERELESGADA